MVLISKKSHDVMIKTCPSCGHRIQYEQQQQVSLSLSLSLSLCVCRVRQDGLVRHFFHRPSKAYTTGTRKRRKVHTDARGGETRWHKTGKTRPVLVGGRLKGYKKILVLYTNYGKQRKPEKTSWIMHQYHLGSDEEEKDGELVVSKVFYQTQPRQCGSGAKESYGRKVKAAADDDDDDGAAVVLGEGSAVGDYYAPSLIAYNQGGQNRVSSPHLLPHFAMHAGGASFIS
ncbi:hypothetical protein BHM03_00032594 [Ensete ventricosum]|nr:hypothetical protein BHM03_00032594 [Ensete ventricosum]